MNEVSGGSCSGVVGRQIGYLVFGWKEFDCVADDWFGTVFEDNGKTPVVIKSWTDIPTCLAMGIPCSSLLWFVVRNDPDSWGSHRGLVEIELAFELGVGRQSWVDSRLSEEIECELRLGK